MPVRGHHHDAREVPPPVLGPLRSPLGDRASWSSAGGTRGRAAGEYNLGLNDRSNPAGTVEKARLRLKVNGEDREVLGPVHHTLLEVLREELGLTGTKHGCELGECGTCTVLLDGRPVLSCLTLPVECEGRVVLTVEGLARGSRLHPLQQAFAELGAAQCGYCTPGFLLVAEALLRDKRAPSRAEIGEALAGNLCRCTGYLKIFEAVELAAERMRAAEVTGA
jgi:aerobic-type carbon monoxide dehydrogenase small subunit (CoxS/CutS family)